MSFARNRKPAIQLLPVMIFHVRGKGHGHKDVRGSGTHSCDVAEIRDGRFVSDVIQGGGTSGEMDVFNEEVSGNNEMGR
jgi:hypothetical protein